MKRTALTAAVVAASLALRLPNLGAPPLERHDFRQTQTAITVQSWLDRGFTVLHYETPVFGPPWQVPFELPTFQATVYVLARAGVPLDLAARLAALAWFYLSAFLLFGLARRYAGEAAAVAALAVYVLSPFSIQWSRAALIDYASVALALAYLRATAALAVRPSLAALAAAVAFGALAAATKITTVAALAPALAIAAAAGLARAWPGGLAARARVLAALALAGGLPLAAGLAWTRWADHVKEASPATRWVTSGSLGGWMYGSLAQRLTLDTWATILERARTIVPGVLGLVLALTLVAAWRRSGEARLAAAAALAGAVLPVVVFFNVYWVHDYYLIAVTPCLALAAGVAVAELLSLPLPWRRPVLVAVAALVLLDGRAEIAYAQTAYEDTRLHPVVGLARLVAEVTPPERWVFIEGDDWSPRIPYLSHRRAFMLRPPFVPADLVAGRPELGTLVCAECAPDLLARFPERTLAGREAGFTVYRLGPPAPGPRLDSKPAIP